MFPNDFPIWQLVYFYYSKWANAEGFNLLLAKLRVKIRLNRNQKNKTEFRNNKQLVYKMGKHSLAERF